MAHDVNIQRRNFCRGTHERFFPIPQQIAQIEGFEITKLNKASRGLAVLVVTVIALFETRAIRIRFIRARQRLLDRLPGCAHDSPVDALDRQFIARFDDNAVAFRGLFQVVVEELLTLRIVFHGLAVVREVFDRNPGCKLRNPADVI